MSGDGGLAMLMGDLLTLRQLNLPVKVIVFKNDSLGKDRLQALAELLAATRSGRSKSLLVVIYVVTNIVVTHLSRKSGLAGKFTSRKSPALKNLYRTPLLDARRLAGDKAPAQNYNSSPHGSSRRRFFRLGAGKSGADIAREFLQDAEQDPVITQPTKARKCSLICSAFHCDICPESTGIAITLTRRHSGTPRLPSRMRPSW
jgi:hypothetical protein